jgi:hypothetical protein
VSEHTEAFLIWGLPRTHNLRMERGRVYDHAAFGVNSGNGITGNFILRNTVWEMPKEFDGTNEAGGDGAKQFDGCDTSSTRSGWLWEYNILEGGWTGCNTSGNMTLRGNLGTLDGGGSTACSTDAEITWDSNVWSNGSCSGDNAQVSDLFSDLGHWTDWTGDDFTYTATNPGIDQGDAGSYPDLDLLGHSRFSGAGPDAGPYEYGAG